MTLTFATGCSGIGAPEMAWGNRLGWKCLWCSEIEPFPLAALKCRWPDVPNVGDFLTIADRIGKDELEAPEDCPKGPQYKAYGNSMCVNVIEWIGRQIENELANPQPLTIYQPEQMEFDF